MRTIVSKIKRKVDSINACLCLKIALQTLGKNQGRLKIGKLNKNSLFPPVVINSEVGMFHVWASAKKGLGTKNIVS